jgi:hypothetical protein
MKVLLTGQAGLEAAIYAINNAALNRWVEKPWEPEDLGLAVQNLLDHHRLRAHVERQRGGLERQARDLRSLHQVGAAVGSVDESARVLEIVTAAARTIGTARAACAVVRLSPSGPCLWGGNLALPDAARAALEASVQGALSERSPSAPPLPDGCQAFMVLEGRPPLAGSWSRADSRGGAGTSSALAEQAATAS